MSIKRAWKWLRDNFPLVTRKSYRGLQDAILVATEAARAAGHKMGIQVAHHEYEKLREELRERSESAFRMRIERTIGPGSFYGKHWRLVIDVDNEFLMWLEHGNSDAMLDCFSRYWADKLAREIKCANRWR